MIKQTELVIPPENLNDKDFLYKSASEKLKLNPSEITAVVPLKDRLMDEAKIPYSEFCVMFLLMKILFRKILKLITNMLKGIKKL